jgi:hypothetical protein
MKHTSIRLSEEHTKRIEETGESPTAIIKKALDAYFNIPDESMDSTKQLIKEHIELYRSEHIVSTDTKAIMAFILEQLDSGSEPLLPEVAKRFGLTVQALPKMMSPLGIRAKDTKRQGVSGRYFTHDMKPRIEEALSKL